MGLFASFRAAVTGMHADRDPEVVRLRTERTARHAADDYRPGEDLDLAWHFARVGRHDEAWLELRDELAVTLVRVRRFFPQCTSKEHRALAAMGRKTIFGAASTMAGRQSPRGLAYAATAHAWWICGLALGGDRTPEVKRARLVESWRSAVGDDDGGLALWAATLPTLKNELLVEGFAAEVWSRLDLPAAERLKP